MSKLISILISTPSLQPLQRTSFHKPAIETPFASFPSAYPSLKTCNKRQSSTTDSKFPASPCAKLPKNPLLVATTRSESTTKQIALIARVSF